MANDLVVQLGAKLDQFQSDMNAAGDTADSTVSRIEQSFANLNPGINFSSFSAAIVAGAAGVAGLVALVAALNESLAEMAKTAERVGLSFSRFQELKFGANSIGIDDTDFSSSLDSFASKLEDAKSKANDLKRVFDANGISITDGNGKLKDANDLLTKAFDLIKRAPSIQDALQIGSFLGVSKQFSQSIFDAGDSFLKLASQANAAGAVIDDATINKAKIFSDEWTKASALWGASLRAALGEILPLLNQAVNGATWIIQSVSSVFGALSAIKDFAFAPDIDTASLNKLTSLLKQYEDIKSTLQSGQPLNPIQLFEATNIPQIDGKVSLDALDKVISQIQDRIKQVNASPASRIVVTPSQGNSVNPGLKQTTDNSRDQFEQGVDQITKRTATIKADTAAVFENNAAQASLRAEFQLLTGIVRDGGEVTQAQIDSYEKLRASMSATQALEASGITLTKEHRDAFLSSSQAIGTATTAFDKAKDSLSKINSASSQIGSALSNAFADAVVEGKSLNDVLLSLVQTLEKAAINSVFASFFNPSAAGGLSPFASALGLGKIGHNATGTDNWSGGPTWVGENGPEIVNLPKGAQVVPNAVARQGAVGTQIQNTFMVAGDVSPGTIDRLQAAVIAAHRKTDRLSQVFTSTQRQQATGVG